MIYSLLCVFKQIAFCSGLAYLSVQTDRLAIGFAEVESITVNLTGTLPFLGVIPVEIGVNKLLDGFSMADGKGCLFGGRFQTVIVLLRTDVFAPDGFKSFIGFIRFQSGAIFLFYVFQFSCPVFFCQTTKHH